MKRIPKKIIEKIIISNPNLDFDSDTNSWIEFLIISFKNQLEVSEGRSNL